MYGIVNKAIQDLITEGYGYEKWEAIRKRSELEVEFFLLNEAYDDAITYKLAIVSSEELNLSTDEILKSLGEWWVLRTSTQHFGSMMKAGGKNLREFLINLPNFHNRISLMYPKLAPPEFKISHLEAECLHLHYFSGRQGLKEFVRGLIQGLSKSFNEPVSITLLQTREEGSDHETFKICWQ
ncbi:MAG: heme NO-binding domain-containing protein [Bacteroidetes bacterium]|nr:heme NO-binding domain-containing protein [Bacteroidota bacterium]